MASSIMSLTNNLTSTNAQYYLGLANADLQASVTRLASGNAIATAADDVAGLAIGTILQTNVATLKACLTNVSQAQSMLGVADGALRNDLDILSKLKSLATQATSGALNNQAYGYLAEQFNSLVAEIDQIATDTNFNGINLIDGSLYAPAAITTGSETTSTNAQGKLYFATDLLTVNTNIASLYINGATIPLTLVANLDTAALTQDQQGMVVDLSVATTAANQAAAVFNVINNALNYDGTDSVVLAAKQALSELTYSYDTVQTITITAKAAGTIGNGSAAGSAFGVCINNPNQTSANNLTLNGGNASGTAYTAASSIGIGYVNAANGYVPTVSAVDGYLNAGSFASGAGTAYNNATATTFAQGTVTNNLIKPLNLLTQGSTGIDASLVSGNPSFIGQLSGFTASYAGQGPNVVDLSIQVGNITYFAPSVNTAFGDSELITFSSTSGVGGSFTVQLSATPTTVSVASQADANTLAETFNTAFQGVTFYQNRNLSSYVVESGIVLDTNNNQIADFSGSTFNMINSDFSELEISDITVSAPVQGATNATIAITLASGEVYQSGYDQYGNSVALGSTITAGTSIGLVSQTNPNNIMVFNYSANAATSLSINSSAGAPAIEAALEQAFGVNTGASSVSFQVGLTSATSIAVQIQSAATSAIFLDDNGNYALPNILSSAGASAAGTILDNAINALTAVIANVGALESRFQYSAANLNTAIQNQDAARGQFLDTDIPSESSNFAQAQVRVQAGVAILAQSNQLPQILLELIRSR